MSRTEVDRGRSNSGPGAVQSVDEILDFLRRRYPWPLKCEAEVAAATGMAFDTVRKWFFKPPKRQHAPGDKARRMIARVYGADLAAEAGLPLPVWRELFFDLEVLEAA